MSLKLEVGQTLKINFGRGNVNNGTLHVRAIVDTYCVVVRRWRGRWHYKAEDLDYFQALADRGFLEVQQRA